MDEQALVLAALGLASGAGYAARRRQRRRAQLPRPRGPRLNVLFVLTDQERSWDQLPAGFIDRHCPARASLRDEGVQIGGAHTPIQLCAMARGAVYTGVHAPNNGLWENVPVPMARDLSKALPTLGTMMEDAGYRVGYAGKWHLSKVPERAGAPVASAARRYGFGESEADKELDGANAGRENDGASVDAALRFIARHRGPGAPWFLALNLVNPHDVMYYTSGDAMTRSRVSQFPSPSARPPSTPLYQEDLGYEVVGSWGEATLPGRPPAIREYLEVWNRLFGTLDTCSEDIAREFQNFYWNCLRDSDRQLGRLLAGLRASGEDERTVVVFTSDHGEYLGAHGLRGKGVSAYREGSRVPFVVRHPEGRRGAVAVNLVSLVDLAPTLLALAGIDPSVVREHYPDLVGHDVSAVVGDAQARTPRDARGILTYWTGLAYLDADAPRMAAEALAKRGLAQKLALARMVRRVDWTKRGHMRGLIDGRWKLSRYFRPGDHHLPKDLEELARRNDVELYDTEADPGELRNLAGDPAHREVLARLNERKNALIREEIGDDAGAFVPFFAR
ncbi:MAG: sulfatase-like hydrolase/transferase [Myxococcota bacterium]